jgi:hypothetical protein
LRRSSPRELAVQDPVEQPAADLGVLIVALLDRSRETFAEKCYGGFQIVWHEIILQK